MGPAVRRLALAAAAGSLLLALAAPARAHAAFVSSDPAPGARLSAAPGIVVLRFTEPLIPALSGARVLSPGGERGEAGPSGEREIRVPAVGGAPGVYEVEWKTVSPVDGHTLRGSFRFGVGVAPADGGETTALAPGRGDLALALLRAAEYAGLLAAAGALVLGGLARREPRISWAEAAPVLPLAVALAAGAATVAGEALLAAGSLPGVLPYLGSTAGLPRVARVVAEAFALGGSLVRGMPVRGALGAALLALAASGHAAAVRPAWAGIGAGWVHLISAGVWAGGILTLARLRPPGGWRGDEARRLLARYSPVALAAFAVTALTGIGRAGQELATVSDLGRTPYGRALTLKVLAVAAMLPLSLVSWRRLLRSPRREAILAVAVTAVAALLAAFPLPPGRLAEADAARREARPSPALPQPGDLSLGGEAGEVLVGLTLRPGLPGENRVLVYVLPLGSEKDAARIDVALGRPGAPLRRCGPTCREGRLVLQGGERLEVRAGGPRGGAAVFEVPPLPAPDGSTTFARLQERMHRLRTYRVEELLRPARPPAQTRYAFQAPDRMSIESSRGFTAVSAGEVQWRREGPGAPWRRGEVPSLRVPFFPWDTAAGAAEPRIAGSEQVDGVKAEVVVFFERSGDIPIWFRLWVDQEGLVHRTEMRAPGHFMDHTYSDFDAPFTVDPP